MHPRSRSRTPWLKPALGQKASEMASSSASTHQDGLEYTKAWRTNQVQWVLLSIQWNKYRSEVVETWRYTGQEQPTKLPKKEDNNQKEAVCQSDARISHNRHAIAQAARQEEDNDVEQEASPEGGNYNRGRGVPSGWQLQPRSRCPLRSRVPSRKERAQVGGAGNQPPFCTRARQEANTRA